MGDLAVFRRMSSPAEKHVYLRMLRQKDEDAFWRLLMTHTDELLPIVYTPTVGAHSGAFVGVSRRSDGS